MEQIVICTKQVGWLCSPHRQVMICHGVESQTAEIFFSHSAAALTHLTRTIQKLSEERAKQASQIISMAASFGQGEFMK